MKNVVFPLVSFVLLNFILLVICFVILFLQQVSTENATEVLDEKTLNGFAQISIA